MRRDLQETALHESSRGSKLVAVAAMAAASLLPGAARASVPSALDAVLLPRVALEPTLPAELRAAPPPAPLAAEPWLAGDEWGHHVVRIRWRAREHEGLSNYRVTFVSDAGGPREVAARWTIPAGSGRSAAGELRAYALELPLAIHGDLDGRAALEAVESGGRVHLLGVVAVRAEPRQGDDRLHAAGVPRDEVRAATARRQGIDGPRLLADVVGAVAGVVPLPTGTVRSQTLSRIDLSSLIQPARGPPPT